MMKCRWWFAIVGALMMTSLCDVQAKAWNRLPTLPQAGDSFSSHPVAQRLVTGLRIGRVRIRFETTRWSDLKRQFGKLGLRRQGDGAETENWTCLSVGPAAGRVQVWLAGSELAGDEFIDGVTAIAGTVWPLAECPQVDPGKGPVELDNGVWIGATKSRLLKQLGRPTAIKGNSITYDYSVPVHDRRLGDGATEGRILLETQANRVVRLTANKDTTY